MTTPAPSQSRRVCRSTALWRRAGSSILVLPLDGDSDGEVVRLDGPAALLWQLVDEPTGVAELMDLLADLHGLDTEDVASGLPGALEELRRAKVLDVVTEGPTS